MNKNPCRLGFFTLWFLSNVYPAQPKVGAATLVEKGQARAVIIVPEKPSPVVDNAARVLRDHIKQMSGAELPIRTEDRITGPPTQGRRLASGAEDKTIKIWDAITGQELLTLTGHTGTVRTLAFSPDGTRLASASWEWRNNKAVETEVKIWDTNPRDE
jgi:WD40 repeat protein